MSEKRHPSKKPPLSQTLKPRLIEKYGGLKAAAQKLDLLSYEALRQDLSKNRYFENDLLKMCVETDLSVNMESLRRNYDFSLKKLQRGIRRHLNAFSSTHPTLNEAFNLIDVRMGRMEEMVTYANEVVPKFFDAMSATDVLAVFMSDEFPAHWLGPEALSSARAFQKAITAGALIVYFHPTYALAQQVREMGCTANMLTSSDVKPAFESFCSRLLSIGTKDADLRNLVLMPCGNPAAFTPQHRSGVYFYRGDGELAVRATEAIPIRHSSDNDRVHSRYWVLTPSYRFTSYLQQICEWTLNKAIKNLTIKGEGQGRKVQIDSFLESEAPVLGDYTADDTIKVQQLRKILGRCYFMNQGAHEPISSDRPSKSSTK